MKEEVVEGWVKIYEVYDFMLSELIKTKLSDSNIEYQIMNKADLGYTMELFNTQMGRASVNRPYKFFVKPGDKEKALEIINEDRSTLLDNPDLDFNDITEENSTDK